MKNIKILIILLCIGLSRLYAQQGPVSAGGDSASAYGSVSMSIGEIDFSATSNSYGTVSQGVQQTYQSIIIGSITGTSFCPGASVSVPYTIRGTYQSLNVFTAQLSNSSGSFTSPVTIGTLTTPNAGTISCVIPSNSIAGTGYRIRIVSNLPTVTSNLNASNLTIYSNPISASSVTTNINCGGGTGVITVTASSGTLPYTGTGTHTVTTGSYTYTVSDAHGCSSTTSTYISQPTPLSSVLTPTAISCYGGTSVITVSGSGGVPSYSGTGTHTVSIGTYTYQVSDSHGCTASNTITITQPTLVVASASNTAIACHGGSCSITVSGSGGTETGAYTGTGTFTEPAGTYSYTISDAHGCTATKSLTVTQPTALSAIATAGTILCNAGTTTISVSGSGGTLNYASGTGTFTEGAGTYSYTVTDAHGCTATASATLTQPSALGFTTIVTNVAVCVPSSGSIVVNAAGGTGTKTYSDNNGSTYVSSSTFSSMNAGNYTVVVKDANSCTSPHISTVVGTNSPVTFTTVVTSPSPCTSATGSIVVTASGGNGVYNYSDNNGSTYGSSNTFSSLTKATYATKVKDGAGCLSSSSNVVVGSNCRDEETVIAETIPIGDFLVYPNPASTSATILFSTDKENNYDVRLLDMTGREVYKAFITSTIGDNQYQLNLSELAKGVYMIVLQSNGDMQQKKIVVQ